MNENVLIRFILDKANRSERAEVLKWIQASQENKETFARLKAKYVFSGLPNKILPQKSRWKPYVYAAFSFMCIPLIAFSIYLYIDRQNTIKECNIIRDKAALILYQHAGESTYIASPGTKSTVILPDSTIVKLNSGSKLIAPNCFAADSRELYLEGEGYFEVCHNENWPMNIHTANGVTVKVLGTTFDLSAYLDDPDVRLTLIEGKVKLKQDVNNFETLVLPKQEVIVKKDTLNAADDLTPVIKEADIPKTIAWTKGEMIFDNTPMSQIIKVLERWYGVNIYVADNSILDYKLTATFTSESIIRVMELIKFSSMVEYKIDGNNIYIRKQV